MKFILVIFLTFSCVLFVTAQTKPVTPQRDGQKDFDFEIGTWKTKLKRLQNPLSGSTTWVEYEGTTVVRKVWDGRANLVELAAEGPAGRFEGLSLRLYDPQTRQWSLNFANARAEGWPRRPSVSLKTGGASFITRKRTTAAPFLSGL